MDVAQRSKEIALVSIDEIKPSDINPNRHSAEQIERLCKVIMYQGFRDPLIISNRSGLLVSGHGRLMAARKLGLNVVPCMYQDFDDADQEYAAMVSENSIASWAELDLAAINLELPNLGPEFDIDLLGIKDFVIEPADKQGLIDDDAIPEPKESRCKTGDLWQLGEHRLLCGDCTVKENVERLMGGEKAALWSSDPPYGINHVATSQEKNQSVDYEDIENDDLQFDELKTFLHGVIQNCIDTAMADNFAFYMWHAMKMQSYAAAAAAAAGILFHRQIIWVKPSLVFGRGHYHWRHELCLMGWLKGNEPPRYGEMNQTTVWECGRENDRIHPTQKPVELTVIPINNHTRPGEAVIDPFLGSGSTLIACEKTGRRCFGMEIDEHYCNCVIERWEKFTGKKAVKSES